MKKVYCSKKAYISIFLFVLLLCLLTDSVLAVDTNGWTWPVPDSKTMSRGYSSGHTGLDIISTRNVNENIVAARNGTVVAVYDGCSVWAGYGKDHSGCNPVAHLTWGDKWGIRYLQSDGGTEVCNYGYGIGVVIDHGGGVWSTYAHMSSVSVSVGQNVAAGTKIGTMGASGNATGRHLHFSIIENSSMSSGGHANGNAINNNPYGNEYIIQNSWNGIRNIYYTSDTEVPVISTARIENITNTSYDVYLKGTDNLSQKLKFKIGTWNDNMSIDDAKWQTSDFVSSKEIRFTVNISDFGNARDVTYHTNAFVIDESGNTSSAKRVGDPYIASLIGELSCDWIETTILPDNVTTANCEIQYNNHYQKKATMSPGTGWTKTGSEIKQYDNVGSVYKSDNKLSTSETRVQVDYFFYHYCGNSSHPTWVERYEDPSYPTRHEILDYSAYNEAAYYDDSNDPNIKQIELRWKSGQWAGGIATCGTYGQSGERWYRGYKYQDRQLVTYYNWVKDSGWTSSRDSSANSVTIRYRLKNGCGARDITLPAGLKEIQASAFEGSTSINEVTIPNGVKTIGSRAFANCTGLTLVRIPSTVSSIGTSAFLNDTNVTLVCQSNSVCVSYAQQNGHPYRTE